jgi:predicted SAM-dependent methyltransferase
VVANILDPLPFGENYADKIVSVATLEHFTLSDVPILLKEFLRVLKPGGTVEIGVPSLKKVIEMYEKEGCTDTVIRYLHGGLKDEYDIHFFVVDPKRFTKELESVGFVKAREESYDFPRHDKEYMMKIVAEKNE